MSNFVKLRHGDGFIRLNLNQICTIGYGPTGTIHLEMSNGMTVPVDEQDVHLILEDLAGETEREQY